MRKGILSAIKSVRQNRVSSVCPLLFLNGAPGAADLINGTAGNDIIFDVANTNNEWRIAA